jgi:hypothetical protein
MHSDAVAAVHCRFIISILILVKEKQETLFQISCFVLPRKSGGYFVFGVGT